MYNGPVSFKEATDQMAARLDTPTAMKYKEITANWDAQFRHRAFFSARVAEADLLGELHNKAQAVAEGRMSRDQARRLIREFFVGDGADALAALGFAPPKDAKGVAQLASIPRLELIVDTNVRMAQETGHYKKWESLKDVYPYGVWRVGYSKVHREAHLERDGKIYAFDHPIWRQSPPGGEFNCHCRRELMTARELAASGKMPVPENVPFQPSSLGFDPGADDWQDPPFGKDVPPKVEKEATRLLEDDLRTEKASMEREAQTAKADAERLEKTAKKAEYKAQEADAGEDKRKEAKTARSRANAAMEYAKGLLDIAKRFVVKIMPAKREPAKQQKSMLPVLRGSEKQVKWAEDIRKGAMDKETAVYDMMMRGNSVFKAANNGDAAAKSAQARMKEIMQATPKEERKDKLYEMYLEAASRMDSASWWIDNRYGIVGTIADMAVKIWGGG